MGADKAKLTLSEIGLALEEFNLKHYPNVQFVFDGRSNMYTTAELKAETDSISILDVEYNKTVVFIINTKVVNTFHMNKVEQYLKTGSSNNTPHEALHVLDVVLKNTLTSLRFINNGKSFLSIPRYISEDLGDGLELWEEFYQSRVIGWKPYINIDVTNKGFLKHQPLVDYIAVDLCCDLYVAMNQANINKLENYVKGLKVNFEIPNQPNTKRIYRVNGLLSSASTFYMILEIGIGNKEVIPKSGVWNPKEFSKAVQIRRWVILNMDQYISYSDIRNFEQYLIHSGKNLNFNVSPVSSIINCFLKKNWTVNKGLKEVTNIFKTQKKNTNLFLVIVPTNSSSSIYGIVKQASEQIVGVLTQCIKSNTLTINNFILKINSKLNGINHLIAERCRPSCMKDAIIFGADISHIGSINNSAPSIAAVTASYDLNLSQYAMEWRFQPPFEEIILDLENIIYKLLNNFKEKTNVIPKKILYFRDGVSEVLREHLVECELVAIRRACLRLNCFYTPPITILVIQKRHHARIFPIHHIDMNGMSGNVCPGMVIDTHITHPTELNFLLCSHSAVKGTSRPTKYHVIWDDSYFEENEIEQLTFYLCFMSARCSRSVSYPAPTYYAHLAAFRIRSYLENKTININRLDEEQVKNQLNSKLIENTPMFYI
ncbi:PREDICTED: protein argonaute 10-like [Diuraphis noxia]|uniref:protein argonaute 10-like n=1 Tax=Diuraphis noxia TaxID=143948 RepID=UPI0007638269|nr:PREDICTED: protein argonaute 10-like [Diuraphis noxia]